HRHVVQHRVLAAAAGEDAVVALPGRRLPWFEAEISGAKRTPKDRQELIEALHLPLQTTHAARGATRRRVPQERGSVRDHDSGAARFRVSVPLCGTPGAAGACRVWRGALREGAGTRERGDEPP